MDKFEEQWLDGIESIRLGDYLAAAEQFRIILEAFHCDSEALEVAHRFRGLCFQLLGDYSRALGEYELSLHANPLSPLALERLAYLLATAPDDTLRDGNRAKELAAVAASKPREQQWASLTILAAAEAESGAFEEAILTYEQALRLMPDDERRKRRGRLEQLRAGQPFRCSPEFDRLHLFEFTRHSTVS